MVSLPKAKPVVPVCVAAGLLLFTSLLPSARAQSTNPSGETTSMVVIVKEASTGEPIGAARITLQFSEPGGPQRFGKAKKLVYNAKTDTQGRYKFMDINKGPIVLTVTSPGHQSYGKELQLENDNQVFEVKLKKPQPLL